MVLLITDKEDLGYKLYPTMYSSLHSFGRGLSSTMFSERKGSFPHLLYMLVKNQNVW